MKKFFFLLSLAAAAVALVSLRSPWFSRSLKAPASVGTTNPTAVYLLPFLALLAAGMLSRAASSGDQLPACEPPP